jgi:hypothetical protein
VPGAIPDPGSGPGGEAVASPSPASAGAPFEPFEPSRTLAGKRVDAPEVSASFTVPKGWRHEATTTDGESSHALTAPGDDAQLGVVHVGRRMLGDTDAARSIPRLLVAGAAELSGGARLTAVEGPSELTIGGQRGGRYVARGTIAGKDLEIFVGGVVIDRYAFLVAGAYVADRAALFRAAADTALATLVGTVPRENGELRGRLVGCWEDYSRSNSGNGSGSFQRTLKLGADGRFTRRTFTSVSAGELSSVSDDKVAGLYRVEGDTLTLQDDGGSVSSFRVRFDRGVLFLGDAKHLPCS